ncbi:MAG: ribosome biogenesis GTPase Der [Arcobacteraceae bacterium]|nr:ribosome biogenesis GTPase Der [Arcobacteraceae bacterium]
MIKIALVGQPNVGKSSLFNRLAKKRVAIVSDVSGTTRDIRRREIKIDDREALMLDTGGISKSHNEIMEDGSEFKIFTNVKRKAIETAKQADVILFMVDGKKIPDDDDKALFYELQALGKKLALVINKIDNDNEKERLWDFYSFGVNEEDMFGLSVSHNRGTKRLFAWLYEQLPPALVDKVEEEEDDFSDLEEKPEKQYYLHENGISSSEEILETTNDSVERVVDNHIRIAIIGKVNVGKSSILNALVGEERSVVSEIAGTTIDPVDETIEVGDKKLTFIDTAGLRRRGKIAGIEKYALMRTEDMLSQANLALIVLDASKPLTDQDEKISGLVDQFGLGTIIVLNKWDENLETFKKLEEQIRGRFKFLYYAPIIAVSAKTGRSIDRLQSKLIEIYDNFTQRIPTSLLNETIEKAIRRHSMPSPAGNMLRIYFSTQFNTSPPTIAVVMNKPKMLHFSYKRYLINFLRDNINFEGTPIRLVARGKGDRVEEEDQEVQYQVI